MPKGIYIRTEEHNRKIGLANKGKKHSEESKRRISLAQKGRIPWNKEKTKKDFPQMSNSGIKKGQLIGSKHHQWKGGRCITEKGYILIHQPTHPFCNAYGYILEHRLVMEEYLGRYLTPKEVVHHNNGNPSDNRIEKLGLFANKSEHTKFHHLYPTI